MGWPGCHVIAKLIFVAFNKHAEIPANSNQPGSCNQGKWQSFLRASQHLALCWVFNFVNDYYSYSSMLLVYLRKRWLSFIPKERSCHWNSTVTIFPILSELFTCLINSHKRRSILHSDAVNRQISALLCNLDLRLSFHSSTTRGKWNLVDTDTKGTCQSVCIARVSVWSGLSDTKWRTRALSIKGLRQTFLRQQNASKVAY